MSLLDRLTGRLPVYRLVTLSLLVLLAVALVLSATGQLFYSPVSLVASALVAVAVSWAASRLLGIAFRVATHDESAVITGLILFFLFLPPSDALGYSVLAFAASVAAASKFLLVWRGRHLVNPAAAAAFVVALTGFGAAGWWVASPALAPVVAVLGFLVLRRTRLLGAGLLFAGLAVLLVTAGLMLFGAAPGQAVLTALGSYPILFLAGFLLSEPMTLPARRRQRLVVAVVVALLFALPLFAPVSIGTFSLSQELALLVGNAVAAAFTISRSAGLRFAGAREVADGTHEFAFTADRDLDVRPGQYVELHVPHRRADRRGSRRHLTVVKADGRDLRVAVRTPEPGSSFKRALLTLADGAEVRLTSVAGDFLLPADDRVPVLLVAGGIGVTPFVRQLDAERARGSQRDIALVYRVASVAEAAYLDDLAVSGARILVVTPDTGGALPNGVERYGDLESALAAVSDPANRRAFVSGSPTFVGRARRALRSSGARRIVTDRFAGY